jgi:tetratricopeptide (TPR) repeat protein
VRHAEDVSRALPPLALAALLAAGALALWPGPPPTREPSPQRPVVGVEVALEAAPPPEARPAPSPSSAPPPAPASAPPPPGCPAEEIVDPPGLLRPSTWSLLRLRVEELNARLPTLARDGSEDLAAGLREVAREASATAAERLLTAPDRVQDGFDVAVAAQLHLGMGALVQGALDQAWHHASTATREAAEDPAGWALLARVAAERDDPGARLAALRRAFALTPDEPAIALALARSAAEAGAFDDATAAVEAYLRAVPEDARVRAWSDRLRLRRALTERHREVRDGGLVVLLAEGDARPILAAMRAGLGLAARLVGRTRRASLTAVVYADGEAMRRATCAPSWSGGVFDGVLHLDGRSIDRPEGLRAVRHEAAHAQLARLRGRAPQWFNEGLAQFVEGEPTAAVQASFDRLAERRLLIPFASLEGRLVVIDDAADARLAYHQSLAMFRYLRERGGHRAVVMAADRIEAGSPEDLLEALLGEEAGSPAALQAQVRAWRPRR